MINGKRTECKLNQGFSLEYTVVYPDRYLREEGQWAKRPKRCYKQ